MLLKVWRKKTTQNPNLTSNTRRHKAHDRPGDERPERHRRDHAALLRNHRAQRSDHDAHRAGVGKPADGVRCDGRRSRRKHLRRDELSKPLVGDELVHDGLGSDQLAHVVAFVPRDAHHEGQRPEDGAEDVLQADVLETYQGSEPAEDAVEERDERHERDQVGDDAEDQGRCGVGAVGGRVQHGGIGTGKKRR